MKKFTVEEIEEIINDKCWKYKIEDVKSWGDCSVSYTETINPGELLRVLRKKAKNET